MGKGSDKRPLQISENEMEKNWDSIFCTIKDLVCDCGVTDTIDNPVVVVGDKHECYRCLNNRGYFEN